MAHGARRLSAAQILDRARRVRIPLETNRNFAPFGELVIWYFGELKRLDHAAIVSFEGRARKERRPADLWFFDTFTARRQQLR